MLAQYQAAAVQRAGTGAELEETARAIAASLDRGMFERWREIRLLGQLDAIRDPAANAATLRPLLHRLQATLPAYAILMVIADDGRVMATSDGRIEGMDVGGRDYARRGRLAPYAGNVHEALLLSPTTLGAEPLRFVDLAAPAPIADGTGVRVVVAHLHWSWADQIQREIAEPRRLRQPGAETFVVGRDGTVLLGPLGWLGRSLPEAGPGAIAAGAQGAGHAVLPWGPNDTETTPRSDFVTGWASTKGHLDYPGLGWTVVTRLDATTAFAAAQPTRNLILGFGALVALIGGGLGWLVAGRLARPSESATTFGKPPMPGATDHATGIGASFAPRDQAPTLAAGERLAAIEADYRALFAVSPIGILHSDFEGRVFFANDAFLNIIGMNSAALAAGHIRWDTLTPPEWLPADEIAIAEAQRSPQGHCQPYEKEYQLADGKRVRVLVSFAILDRATGQVSATVMDLTELQRGKAMLAEREAELARVQRIGRVGGFVHDFATGLCDRSPEFLALHGLPADAVRESSEAELERVHPADRPMVRATLQAAAHGKVTAYEAEYRVLKPAGEEIWIRATAELERDPDTGRVLRMRGAHVDITKQKLAEAALDDERAYLRSVLDASTDCTKVVEPDGRLSFMNANGLCLLEVDDPSAIDGIEWASLWPESERGQVREAVAAALAGQPARFEAFSPTAKGSPRWWEVAVAPVTDADGTVARIVSVSRDVSARRAAQDSLAESEVRWRSLLDNLHEGLCLCEMVYGPAGEAVDFRYLETNGSWERMTGLPASAVRGRLMTEALPGNEPVWRATYAALLRLGEPIHFTMEVAGTAHMLECHAFAVTGARFGVSLLDITERRQQETALTASETRLRFALEAAELGTWTIDLATQGVEYDSRFRTLLGIGETGASDLSAAVVSFVHPDDRGRVTAALATGFGPGGSGVLNLEHRIRRPDGETRWVSTRGRVIGSEGVARAYGTIQDITARVADAAELEAAAEQMNLALKAAQFGVFAWDLRSGVMSLSERGCELYICPPGVVPSFERMLRALHPEDRAATEAAIVHAMEERGEFDVEHRIRLPGGTGTRWLRLRGCTEVGRDGSLDGLRGVIVDIDPQKRVEELLRNDRDRLEARVEERTRALGLAAAELHAEMTRREQTTAALLQAQKIEALGQLTGGVAHDFNNVLAAVMGSFRLIEHEAEGNDAILDFARNGGRAAEKAASLVRQLMAFARTEDLSQTSHEPATLLAGAEELIRTAMGSDGTTVLVEAPAALWPVVVDEHRLQVALLNLAINARDAMRGQGCVTITARNVEGLAPDADHPPGLRPGADCIVFSVQDTGSGMSPEVLARATEPFFTTKPRGQGTGLGLAMVHGFAHQSGGTLRILSMEGEGTTVEMWLLRAARTAPETAPRGEPVEGAHGNATVLVVDDDETVRFVTASELRRLGYKVLEANSGASGIVQALAAEELDLLVSDIVMPDGDGPTLAAELRKARPGIPVLFVSGFADNRAGLGGGTVLAKPFTPQALAERVLVALGRMPRQDKMLRRLREPSLRDAYLTWCRLRNAGGGGMPRLADFTATEVAGAPEGYIVAWTGEGDAPPFRFLSLGTALAERLGPGLDEVAVMQAAEQDRTTGGMADAFRRCAKSGVPQHDYARYRFGDGEAPVSLERLLLPLAQDDEGVPTHLFGLAVITPTPDRPAGAAT